MVVGYGSIGQRHVSLLKRLGVETAVVSRSRVIDSSLYFNSDLESAIRSFNPQFIIISNETAEHYPTFLSIARTGWKGTILVEKPLFHEAILSATKTENDVFVAYNLRFHPILQRLKDEIQGQKVIAVMTYAGQYLPNWRPGRDYRTSYSARQDEGGGVLRDLSHELDYLIWLFGNWRRVTALGGRFSSLDISADDAWGILMETDRCPMVSLQINYLDRPGRRETVVVTDLHTYKIDLIRNTFEKDGNVETLLTQRNDTYFYQLQALLNRSGETLCTWEEGNRLLRLIKAIERSQGRWVRNEEIMHDLR